MADATTTIDDLPPEKMTDYDCGLSVPPFDTAFFAQQFIDDDGAISDNHNNVNFDFDDSFDDLYIPTADELEDLLNPAQFPEFGSQLGYDDANFLQFVPNEDRFDGVLKSNCSELRHGSGDGVFTCDHSSDDSGVLNTASSGLESHQISGFLNVSSPESGGSNRETFENCGGAVKISDCPSPESRGSENCGSNVSEDSNDRAARSVSSSPCMNSGSTNVSLVDQKIKSEQPQKNNFSSSLLKRKKDREDLPNSHVESRINKHRKSNCNPENNANVEASDDDEKRKARLIRNRESAQLSRQRKKNYVEELEEKVKMMQSTIQGLNAKISCFMAENATLRQQMGGGGAVPPPPMAPPPSGMYPHPAMMPYPWMPYPPPYMVKPQGSQVPLVPIPRLKPQQPSQTPKMSKKADSKKNAGPKTKKVAGISFLGLLFFMMLFGVLVPIVNMRYGGVRETMVGGERYVGGGFYEKKYHGRVLMVNGSEADGKFGKSSLHCGQDSEVRSCNESEPLVASLYVPRNDKLVKIDGNLIIHSVLASEKAMTPPKIVGGETGLAVPGGIVPSNPVSGRNGARLPQLPALGSSSVNKDSRQASDGRIQEWFREGLSGPMLSSGMCTEVFQFDVSPASASGAMISATPSRNMSEEQNHNSTHFSKGRYRRILNGLTIPLPESSHNISRQHEGSNSQNENLKGNKSVSSMVVSVLVDPREEADVDGVMGKKSLPQIFVVVLIDSVKYVTYSCMLPFKGSALHLVAA